MATDCARARESVSVQLDGELPELELDRLETHLRICPACVAWADQVREATQLLREASLEVPVERFELPRRARRWRVSSAVAVASAAAVVATMFVAPGQHASGNGPSLVFSVSSLADTNQHLVAGRLIRLEDGRAPSSVASTSRLFFRPA